VGRRLEVIGRALSVSKSDRKISIGRERKRQLKTMIHLQGLGKLEMEKLSYLRGMLAFVADVEPAFRQALVLKFGGELMTAIESGLAVGVADPIPFPNL
jgi:hypothetical protein